MDEESRLKEHSPRKDDDGTPLIKGEQGDVWATLKLVCMSSAGLVADGWDLQVTNLVLAMLTHVYPEKVTVNDKGLAAAATLIGVILGQLSFGIIADVWGRKHASIATACLTISGTVAAGCVSANGPVSLITAFAICRFVAGIGIGGEYPLTAAITKEATTKSLCLSRRSLLVVNMLSFNVGNCLMAALVAILMFSGCSMESAWRVTIIVGAAPSLLAVCLRFRMEISDTTPFATPSGTVRPRLTMYFANIREVIFPRLWIFVGACLAWMVFNFSAYGQTAFDSVIIDEVLSHPGDTPTVLVIRDAIFTFVGGIFCAVGSVLGGNLVHRISLKALQTVCFGCFTVCMIIVVVLFATGDPQEGWQGGFCVAIFFVRSVLFGLLGLTTYLVPAEHFPAATRTTVVGFAAASGKVGAAIGSGVFPILEHGAGFAAAFGLCGGLSVVGILITQLCTPGAGAKEA